MTGMLRPAIAVLATAWLSGFMAGCGAEREPLQTPKLPRAEARDTVRRVVSDTGRTIAGTRARSHEAVLSGASHCGEANSGLSRDTFAESVKAPAVDIDGLLARARDYWASRGYEIIHVEAHSKRPAVFASMGPDFHFRISGRKDLNDIFIVGSGPCYSTDEK